MMSLAAHDSTAGAPLLRPTYTAEQELEHHLANTRQDAKHKHWLFGSLLAGRVYIVDYEIVLGHDGPYFEHQPRDTESGRGLRVYTSPARVPTESAEDAEAIPFAELLDDLPEGVSLTLNPEGPQAHRISADELDLLRRVLATD